MRRWLTRVMIPVGIVMVAGVCAGGMFLLSPSAERSELATTATPVEVVLAHPTVEPAVIQGNGTVQPAQRVAVVPEVSGRIVSVSDQLVPGGRFKTGEAIARIDERDYVLAVRQESSRVHQAELELQLERGRQEVAQREWALLGDGRGEDEVPLALRKPQLANVEQAVEAARSGLARAELQLERTVIRAPFNAVVIDESLDIGQVVGPTTPVLTLVGTDRFWVRVAVQVSDLDLLSVGEGTGSPARVVQSLGDGSSVERLGRAIHLGGELDPQTKTATVIVAIDRPLEATEGPPMLPGAYVDVEIEGREVADVSTVPRSGLRDGRWVLLANAEHQLERRSVEVVWGTRETVAVRGLDEGDQVITSAVPTPIEGMPVQVQSPSAAEAEQDDTPETL